MNKKNSKTITVDVVAEWTKAREQKSSYVTLVRELLIALDYTGYWGDVTSLTVNADGSYKVKVSKK